MPIFQTNIPPFKVPRQLTVDWPNFAGGLNTYFGESEVAKNELTQSQNLMLIEKGTPTKRWGTGVYYLAGETKVRGLTPLYKKSGTNQLLSITDDGFLTAKSNASYSSFTGVSWASGYNAEMAQINDNIYIVNGQRELARCDGTTLEGFPTVSPPSGVFATQISGVSGTNTFSYYLTHISSVGETLPASAFWLHNQPADPEMGSVKLSWTNASTASGIRIGTNIYGRAAGDETFIATLDGEATQWIDNGDSTPTMFAYPPEADSTGGPIAKYIKRWKDRLIFAGIDSDPTMLLISGRVPNHEKFDFGSGGGFVRIEPDSGDNITGVEIQGDKIIVFKERSIWQVEISMVQVGNYYLIEPKYELITSSVGCASPRSIIHVENDIIFLAKGGRGIFVLGNEPGIIGDILRTNEVSVKVRNYFQNLTNDQEINATAIYNSNKYLISFPSKNETMCFDRERSCWIGPWTFDGTIFVNYEDSNGNQLLLLGDDDSGYVDQVSKTLPGDRGTAMSTILRTRRESFGDWTNFKTIKNIFSRWKNVTGTVDVNIRLEGRTGNTITAESFTVATGAGNSGWGADLYGKALWGDTEIAGKAQDLSEVIKQSFLQKMARDVEVVIKTDELNDNYELSGIRMEAQEIGPAMRPISWRT